MNPKPAKQLQLEFEAIGTQWLITAEAEKSVNWSTLAAQLMAYIADYDQTYSRFRADSWLMMIGGQPGRHRLPVTAKPLFDVYSQLYALTAGAMTPLIGATMEAAGYDAQYSLRPRGPLLPLPSWSAALDYSYPYLTVKQPVILDVGAAGKGYLVDLVAGQLQAAGAVCYVINAGGDIRVFDKQSAVVEVGLEHPVHAEQIIGKASLVNQSICGSAGNRRQWAGYTHIIDPHRGRSPRHISATWVVADSCLVADALSTALFFVSPDKLTATFDFEYAVVASDLSLQHSAQFPATFYS